ncbi:site-specific integrase [Methylobacterium oxalidis]|uniref:Integrase n=1 Tax=Methylobacterium oxalidis TaxID=944322 RepID=A0A512JAS6_9HYPH|nr:site-specific integrase [Methylobacterium oxalidis]GEP07056.1 integrase [Methylobacterium oxalidis]GJE34980.1 Tyrosine recombinase XerD [Methylobacterium oxalidis]GLS67604.1 integrase [Methylobacterium oxalidis]
MRPHLTSDNHHLSRFTLSSGGMSPFPAINARADGSPPEEVRRLIEQSLSANTRRAYLSDLAHFEAWGGVVPATPTTVAAYLADYADRLRVATLVRRVTAIGKVHEARGLPNPVRSELVRATLRGIRRTRGSPQREARPLLREDLGGIVDALDTTLRDRRDRALLLVGFAGGFRRSELVGLDRADIEPVREGLVVTLRRSKTDQAGKSRKIGIPHGRTRWCPVSALEAWLSYSGIKGGPLFRPINRHGHVASGRLSGEAVSIIVQERAAAAGLDPRGFSGHSLRSGMATSAARAGVPSWKIRTQTGHASDAMLARYIRSGELFIDNAVSALL